MNPWVPAGRSVPSKRFGRLSPERVLVDFSYPVLFTCRDSNGSTLLVFHVEEVLEPSYLQRYIAAPTTAQTIDRLLRGELSVRDALVASWMWVLHAEESGNVSEAWEVVAQDLPNDFLPEPTTMISADLEPALVLKFSGANLQDGNVPASILEAAGESVQASLRELIGYLAGQAEGTSGRRSNRHRRLYNLPAQRIAFGSLEVAFRRPLGDQSVEQASLYAGEPADEPQVQDSTVEQRMWPLLRRGLRWLEKDLDAESLPAESDQERLVVLRALEKLTPATDLIEEVAVSGKMVTSAEVGKAFRLSRESRTRVRELKRALEVKLKTSEQVEAFEGLVRGLDLDRRTFILRTMEQIIDGEHEGTVFALVEDDDLFFAQEVNHQPLNVRVLGSRIVSPDASDPPWDVVQLAYVDENDAV